MSAEFLRPHLLAETVERTVLSAPGYDTHTHLYAPAFGNLLPWGIDGLRPIPSTDFLIAALARENQHELCVLARKFRNLHVFGCWWFTNTPSLIDEMTRMRIELLGPSMTAQHSDARVLDQLTYKSQHSRRVIAGVLKEKYLDLPRRAGGSRRTKSNAISRHCSGGLSRPFSSAVSRHDFLTCNAAWMMARSRHVSLTHDRRILPAKSFR